MQIFKTISKVLFLSLFLGCIFSSSFSIEKNVLLEKFAHRQLEGKIDLPISIPEDFPKAFIPNYVIRINFEKYIVGKNGVEGKYTIISHMKAREGEIVNFKGEAFLKKAKNGLLLIILHNSINNKNSIIHFPFISGLKELENGIIIKLAGKIHDEDKNVGKLSDDGNVFSHGIGTVDFFNLKLLPLKLDASLVK